MALFHDKGDESLIARTGDRYISTPAVARQAVGWALKSAADTPNGSYFALIAAKVFTAFMFEGIIHHLGEKLCPNWNDPIVGPDNKNPRPALARQPLAERHKAVRRLLGLVNSDRQYQEIQSLAARLTLFRDCFAHPKEHHVIINDYVQSELESMPDIAWEAEINAQQIEGDYQEPETYCLRLLDAAASLLESTDADGWSVWQQRFPHLSNLKLEAAYLKGFLHCRSHSALDYSR